MDAVNVNEQYYEVMPDECGMGTSGVQAFVRRYMSIQLVAGVNQCVG